MVSEDEYAMYAELGFIAVGGSGDGGYEYLLYPHRPIVAYDTDSGELLNEYCVGFPDRSEPAAGSGSPTPTTCSPSGCRCAPTSGS